jgi:transposase
VHAPEYGSRKPPGQQLESVFEKLGVPGDLVDRVIDCRWMARRTRRYPSDTSDQQWAVIEPLLPPVNTGGRPEKHRRRTVVDAIFYVVRTGCSWRQLPADFPPWQTVYWYFVRFEQAKATEKILPVVRGQLRLPEGRDPQPSAGQSIPRL